MNDPNGYLTARKKKRTGERTLPATHHRLLLTFYFWRYLTVQSVHRLLPSQYTASYTTARLHVGQLRDAGLLKEVRRGSHQWYVYAITRRGYHLIRHRLPDNNPWTREEAVRDGALDHELAISAVQTDLFHLVQQRSDADLIQFDRRYFHHSQHLPYTDRQGIGRRLEPDLGSLLLIRKPATWYLLLMFLEQDMGTESPAAFGAKLQAYADWYADRGAGYLTALYAQHHAPDPQPTFRLHVVTQSRRSGGTDFDQLIRLYTQSLHLPGPIRRSIYFTTRDLIRQQSGNPLAQPIWYPARDFRRSWLNEIEDDLSSPGKQPHVYRFVGDRLSPMTRWPTLPLATGAGDGTV